MRFVHDDVADARALLLMLPGALQRPEDLLQAGFAKAVRARGLPADFVAVDFELPFVSQFADGSAAAMLHRELLPLAASRRYDEIWLCGISIGGAVAAAYADAYLRQLPPARHGSCLLAPYPGNGRVVNAILQAGGLERWTPSVLDEADSDFTLWRWLRTCRPEAGNIFLGYGSRDRYAPGLQMMAQALGPACVAIVDGGHDLPSWALLWENFLERLAKRPEWSTNRT